MLKILDKSVVYELTSKSMSDCTCGISKDLTLCRAKVNEFQISEAKCESLCDESIVQIKQQEKTLIDAITKHSPQVLQNRHVIFVLCSVHGILSVIIFGCTS
jgi:hypothetical protein